MGGVPTKHHSKSKVGRRRSQLALKRRPIIACPACKGPTLSHVACPHCAARTKHHARVHEKPGTDHQNSEKTES